MSLLTDLQWRYAAKRMNGQAVPEQQVDYIVEAARLAPSSSGLQPYHVLVIRDKALIARIAPHTLNNQQLNDASHLLVFAAWDNYTEARVNECFERSNRERDLPDSVTDAYRTRLLAHLASQSAHDNHQHAAKQSYLAAMCAMMAAAEQKVDCTPMEGFDFAAVDALLNLPAQGLKSTLLLPLGYRDADNDWLVKLKKIRQPREMFVTDL